MFKIPIKRYSVNIFALVIHWTAMSKHVQAIIQELKIILNKIAACIMSINKDIKTIDCSAPPNPEAITTSVTHKLEILRQCTGSIQRICQHLKECYTSKLSPMPVDVKQAEGEHGS